MVAPLQQFTIYPLIQLKLIGWDISFTNASLFMLLTTGIIIAFLHFSVNPNALVPGRLQIVSESLCEFGLNMIQENIGKEGLVYFPYIFSLFLFVLIGNLLGMIPGGFTFTSHIIVTFTLSVLVVLSVTLIGFIRHGRYFFKFFYPEGTPLFLAPLIVPIEVISYLSRTVSLSVRLFANMMAGHAMIKIFAGVVVTLIGTSLFPVALTALALNVAITGFEFLIALLQAYVFTILTCIYLNDSINLH